MKHLLLFALISLLGIRATVAQVTPVATLNFRAKIDMPAFTPSTGQIALLSGESAPGDQPVRIYWYDPASTAADDGENVIKPTSVTGAGRYIKTAFGAGPNISAGPGITITGTWPTLTIGGKAPTISTTNRSIGTTGWAVSGNTHFGIFTYSVTCSVTNPLLAGTSSSTVLAQYSTDGGTNWLDMLSIGNSSAVGVTVTLQLTNGQTGIVGGIVPRTATHVRVTATNSGTASASIVRTQEATF